MTRDSRSRPKWSVPNQCSALGGTSRNRKLLRTGSYGASRLAKHATMSTSSTRPAPTVKERLRASRPRAGMTSRRAARSQPGSGSVKVGTLSKAHPGVHDGVKHVHHDIDHQVDQCHEKQASLD